jgi:hypothetical protein
MSEVGNNGALLNRDISVEECQYVSKVTGNGILGRLLPRRFARKIIAVSSSV